MIEHTTYHDPIMEGELKLFRALWNHSDDNMFIVRRDKRGEYINEKANGALEKTFLLEPGQLDGIALRSIVEPEVYLKIKEQYDECIQRNKPISYDEVHTINEEEGERYWNTMILPVTCDDEETIRIIGISREITENKQAQQLLTKSKIALEEEVAKRTEALNVALDEMEKISVSDKLTGLYNRVKLDQILEEKITTEHIEKNFSLILLDIDLFKQVNDSFGHQVGDSVLKDFAEVLHRSVRESDTLGRWGGEEFMIICTDCDAKNALSVAENIRQKLDAHNFDKVNNVSASFGITTIREDDSLESFIQRADQALYEAKNQGRDCIIVK